MPPKITIPTYITIIRILLVPVFAYLFLTERYEASVITLIAAGLTDALDGFIARRFNMRSRLGSMLDPAADKILMLVGLFLLSLNHWIPWAFTFLVVGRDVLISAGVGVLNLMKVRLYYKPTIISKMATTSQIAVIAISFFQVLAEERPHVIPEIFRNLTPPLQTILIYVASALTLITVFQYGYLFYKFYRFGERKV